MGKERNWYTVTLTNNSLDQVQHHCNPILLSNILRALVPAGSTANRGELMCTSLCTCTRVWKPEQLSQWTEALGHHVNMCKHTHTILSLLYRTTKGWIGDSPASDLPWFSVSASMLALWLKPTSHNLNSS